MKVYKHGYTEGRKRKNHLNLKFFDIAAKAKGCGVIFDMDAQGTVKKQYECRLEENPPLVEVGAGDSDQRIRFLHCSLSILGSRSGSGSDDRRNYQLS